MRLAPLLLVLLAQAAPAPPALVALAPPAPAAERATVTVLATTDTHGFIYPYDYFTKQPAARGLAAAATLMAAVRRETPHVLLVDCGDTIQGSSLAGVYETEWPRGRPARAGADDAGDEPHRLRRHGASATTTSTSARRA